MALIYFQELSGTPLIAVFSRYKSNNAATELSNFFFFPSPCFGDRSTATRLSFSCTPRTNPCTPTHKLGRQNFFFFSSDHSPSVSFLPIVRRLPGKLDGTLHQRAEIKSSGERRGGATARPPEELSSDRRSLRVCFISTERKRSPGEGGRPRGRTSHYTDLVIPPSPRPREKRGGGD